MGDLPLVSFISYTAVGILIAELILRLRTKDPVELSENRLNYWLLGLFSGLLPDLDFIPTSIH